MGRRRPRRNHRLWGVVLQHTPTPPPPPPHPPPLRPRPVDRLVEKKLPLRRFARCNHTGTDPNLGLEQQARGVAMFTAGEAVSPRPRRHCATFHHHDEGRVPITTYAENTAGEPVGQTVRVLVGHTIRRPSNIVFWPRPRRRSGSILAEPRRRGRRRPDGSWSTTHSAGGRSTNQGAKIEAGRWREVNIRRPFGCLSRGWIRNNRGGLVRAASSGNDE